MVDFLLIWYVYIPIGIFVPLFLMGVPIAPMLKNKPSIEVNGRVEKSDFGFFTELPPGICKIKERGGDFLIPLMNYTGHTYAGMKSGAKIPIQDPKRYWVVVESGDDPDFDPLKFPDPSRWDFVFGSYRYPWWLWKIIIFKATKLIFTGIWPFQKIRVMPMEYLKELPGLAISATGQKKKQYEKVTNFSDHFRIASFDFLNLIESADTSDGVPLEMLVAFTGRVFNPWLAAYRADRSWTVRVNNFLPGAVNDYTRGKPLDEVYTGEDTGVTETVESLGKRNRFTQGEEPIFWEFGIEIIRALVPNRSIIDHEVQRKVSERAVALADKRATIIRAEGTAKAIELESRAITEGGEEGRLAAKYRRDKEVVNNLPNGASVIVTLGDGESSTDPLKKTNDLLKASLIKKE